MQQALRLVDEPRRSFKEFEAEGKTLAMSYTKTASFTLVMCLGAKNPLMGIVDALLTLSNDREVNRGLSITAATTTVTLPFHDGPGDDYRLVLTMRGYEDCGGFVHADAQVHHIVSLLLIPRHAVPRFFDWEQGQRVFPAAAHLLQAGVDAATAAAHYAQLAEQKPLALASLMNLSAAMQQLVLGGQKTPIDFIQQLIWDSTLAQDRLFAWADPSMLPLVRAAAREGEFAEEPNPGLFHPGSTCSYKQTQFDYANVQLTFHENDKKLINGVECIKIEPDMDLYKDLIAHGLGEVIPNRLENGLTNPLAVLALRWIDAVQGDEPLFDPGYTLA